HAQAGQLVVVVAAQGQSPRLVEGNGQISAAEAGSRLARIDALESDQQVIPFPVERGHGQERASGQDPTAWRKAVRRKVCERLHLDGSLDAVRFHDPTHPEVGPVGRHTISTITRSWFLRAAAGTAAFAGLLGRLRADSLGRSPWSIRNARAVSDGRAPFCSQLLTFSWSMLSLTGSVIGS